MGFGALCILLLLWACFGGVYVHYVYVFWKNKFTCLFKSIVHRLDAPTACLIIKKMVLGELSATARASEVTCFGSGLTGRLKRLKFCHFC